MICLSMSAFASVDGKIKDKHLYKVLDTFDALASNGLEEGYLEIESPSEDFNKFKITRDKEGNLSLELGGLALKNNPKRRGTFKQVITSNKYEINAWDRGKDELIQTCKLELTRRDHHINSLKVVINSENLEDLRFCIENNLKEFNGYTKHLTINERVGTIYPYSTSSSVDSTSRTTTTKSTRTAGGIRINAGGTVRVRKN
jgi:hypothetical protein